MNKKSRAFLLLLFLFSLGFFLWKQLELPQVSSNYLRFHEHPSLDKRMRKLISPHLLPLEHPAYHTLERVFGQGRVTRDKRSLLNAGFEIIASMQGSYVTIARHPALPGYVFKLYLDVEKETKDAIPQWEWLTRRCVGAKLIRDLIEKEGIRHFSIPDKWLYLLPVPDTIRPGLTPVIVVETDMQIEGSSATAYAWKHLASREHLDELHTILKRGYGTIGLVRNIPYTKEGKFAFTDTEYPVRALKLKRVLPYLSDEMQVYWKTLIGKKSD